MGLFTDILPKSGTADKFIGATLVALKPVNVYSSPNGALFKSYKAGQTLGSIFSYVTKPDGLWWELDNSKFVKHGEGLFDKSEIEKSLQMIETQREASIERKALEHTGAALGDIASGFFGFLKWPLLIGIVGFAAYLFVIYKKK